MNERIKTKTGLVRGCRENGFYAFKGIPYAKAERFEAPQAYAWEGELDCTEFGKKAMQVWDKPSPWAKPAKREDFSEDCLNLNIYVPESIEEGEKLPVLLEIHGGGYQDGSNQGRTAVQAVRDEKIIYVAINYRLGILGYLYLGELLGEKYQTSGNNGLLDQLMSVKWVAENIASFGGDPEKITVLGSSAGGKSIGALMMLPDFDKYVSQLILSSGATQSIRSLETSKVTANRYMETLKSMKKELGLSAEEITGDILLKLSADDIIKVQKEFTNNPGNTCMFGPVADGVIIAEDWTGTAIQGTFWNGSAMVGCSRRELDFYKMFNPNFLNAAPSIADALFGINGEIAKAEYAETEAKYAEEQGKEIEDSQKTEIWSQILTDYMYRCYSYRLAERLAKKGCQVWQYSMEFLPALHCWDQNLAFGGPNPEFYKEEKFQIAKALSDRVWKSFVNFVKNGNPGEADWEALDPENKKCMYWNAQSEVLPIPENDTLTRFPEEVYILK